MSPLWADVVFHAEEKWKMVSCTNSCRLLHLNSNWCWRTAKTSRLRVTGFKLKRRWWEQQVVTKRQNKFCPATSALSARTAKVPLLLRVQHLGKSLLLARCWRDISPSCWSRLTCDSYCCCCRCHDNVPQFKEQPRWGSDDACRLAHSTIKHCCKTVWV